MKNRKLGVVINLTIISAFLAVAIWLVFLTKNKYQDGLLHIVAFSLIGMLANYQLALILHELGHTLFAKLCKMNVKRINFGLFFIDCENKKLKFFAKTDGEAGEILFSSANAITEKQIKLVAFGGLLFSLIYVALCYLLLLFFDGVLITCLFAIGGLSALYLLFVNILPIDKTSDGAILLSRKEYPAIMAAVINHQRAVEGDEIPVEAEIFKKSTQALARYYHYLYLLLDGQREEAFSLINGLSEELDELTNEEYALILPEIITVSCLQNLMDDGLSATAEIFFDEELNNPAFLRAHYLYRKHHGELAWAEGLHSSYLKALDGSPLFINKIEKSINI